MPDSGSMHEPVIGPLIRARRKQLDLTLRQMGDRARVSVGYLSQIERGNASPSLGTLAQIAQALDVGLDYFVATPRPSDALTRAEERTPFSILGSAMAYEQLNAEFAGRELASFIMHVPPGFTSEKVAHEGEELIYVLDGSIKHRLGHETFDLTAGDSLHFKGNRQHGWANETVRPARILWVGTTELFRRRRAAQKDLAPAGAGVPAEALKELS